MSYDQWFKILLGLSLALYALSMLTAAFGKKRVGWGMMVAGWLFNASVVGLNWWIAGEPPLGNMFHVMVFLSLCMLPALLVLIWRDGLGWLLPWFAGASIFPLIGSFFMMDASPWRRAPALQSDWFVSHVVSYMFSYALCTVAFLVGLVLVVKRLCGCKDEKIKPFASAEYKILRLAFPFLTFGMLSGALWAEEAWGKYWSWDVKESWALVTWLFYLVYFHCRSHSSNQGSLKSLATWAHLAAYSALIFTYLVVNLGLIEKLTSALHSYA